MANRGGVAISAVLLCSLVASSCDSTTDQARSTEAVDVTSGDPNRVAVQIGEYRAESFGEEPVFGPTLVVYGDGTAYWRSYAEVGDTSVVKTGRLTAEELAQIRQAATGYRPTAPPSSVPADLIPVSLAVDGDHWSVYLYPGMAGEDTAFREMVEMIQRTVERAATQTWTPPRWIVRNADGPCSVVEQPGDSAFNQAPVFPHALDKYPLGPTEC